MAEHPPNDELLPAKIYLIDRSAPLVEAWRTVFAAFPDVEVRAGDYFQQPADAIVSPANSFGIMDGGLDRAIRDQLGHVVQMRIQRVILDKYHGEMPVGAAEIIETSDARWKYMAAAPTMRIPESVSSTIHAYLAFRAILVAIENFNRAAGEKAINSLVCCGLGAGVGDMSPGKCAGQMRLAYKSVIGPAMIGGFESIRAFHGLLRQV